MNEGELTWISVDELPLPERERVPDREPLVTWPQLLRALEIEYPAPTSTGKIDMLCLFHTERTASFRMWPEGGCYCHGCQFKGTQLEFVDQLSQREFSDDHQFHGFSLGDPLEYLETLREALVSAEVHPNQLELTVGSAVRSAETKIWKRPYSYPPPGGVKYYSPRW